MIRSKETYRYNFAVTIGSFRVIGKSNFVSFSCGIHRIIFGVFLVEEKGRDYV